MATKRARRWSDAQIKEHIKKIQEVIEQHKRTLKKGYNFIAITPEEIKEKLKRVNSPVITSQGWSELTSPGGAFDYSLSVYNPDPYPVRKIFAHVWVGSGNIDPVVGTFLLNVDTRFPRLTEPDFMGMTLAANGGNGFLSFTMTVPASVERTKYLLNCCLMKVDNFDVGVYLDRGLGVFEVA